MDAGGTFTDFMIMREDGRLESFKLRSDPAAPARVILDGLARIGLPGAEVIHGSTVATNALLERKGAKTAFVTTRGFEDILAIGRQNRAQLYDLTPPLKRHIVPSSLCFGIAERTWFNGAVGERPAAGELSKLRAELRRRGVQSVALCFLHSYSNPDHERLASEALQGSWYLCRSSEVSPEYREYERASTTVINAYVGPLMDAYLGELDRGTGGRVSIMQSNGGFISAGEARRYAVRTILSGPAGGVVGAAAVARASGFDRILSFDMGGTSTDVSLWHGQPRWTTEASVDGVPVRVPMLDIHTVGAGGGSIARVDAGGLLRVGPESAGADPGPACYGTGDQPTVTDAHVVLGRIVPERFLGGEMKIEPKRAEAAVDRIARALKISRGQAAEGIVRVANASMERAIRAVSMERGHDPRQFPLVAFGGCGGLHACELARGLGIRTIIVPRYAGALSALGMLLADRTRDYSAGALNVPDVEKRFRDLEKQARTDMPGAMIERLADMRYAGQSYELTVPWNQADPPAPFHRAHQREYGYSDPGRPIEIVTVRVRAVLVTGKPALPRQTRGLRQRGPALLSEYGSTTWVAPGWSFVMDRAGNAIITWT